LAAQPPEKAASVATAIHEFDRFIRNFCILEFKYSNLATTCRGVN
jgi:hypothetical protein